MGSPVPPGNDRSRTYWTSAMERYFVDLMLEHMHKGNRVGHTFNKQAWTDMLAVFNVRFGSQYDKDVLKSRYTNLWKQFNDIKKMLGRGGFSWDETRHMVVADDYVWDAYIKVHPDARPYKTKSVLNFSDLCVIYGYTTADGRYSRSSHDMDIGNEVHGVNLGGGPGSTHSNTKRSRMDWTAAMDLFFIELLLDQQEKGNKLNNSYTKEAWTEMLTSFNAKFGPQHTKRVLRHRYKKLFKYYGDITVLLKQNDFSWDANEQMVVANDDAWNAYIKAHPQARSYRTRSMPNYNDLQSIFGSAVINGSQNICNMDKYLEEDTVASKTGTECSRTYWTPRMDRYFIDLLLGQANRGNRIGQIFIAQAWSDMIKSFNTNFRSNHEKEVLKNRYKHLKRQYNDIKTLLGEVGFSWDDTREMVAAEEHVWDAYVEVHPNARSYRVKTLPNYHKMCIIYGQDSLEGRYCRLARTEDLDFVDVASLGENNSNQLFRGDAVNVDFCSEILMTNSDPPTAIEPFVTDSNPKLGPKETETSNPRQKRVNETPLALRCCGKVQRNRTEDVREAFTDMANVVSKLVNGKMDKNDTSIERAVDALQAIPDVDDELLLDGCDILEDEKKAKTFLALDASLRKKWLLRKLGRCI